MSLAQFSLDPILITDVEVGLDRDDGRGPLFFTGDNFVLDVHDEPGVGT